MKQLFLLLSLSLYLITQPIKSQTIYYDADWIPTSQQNAVYYRPAPITKDSGFVVEDYYMSGQLQMKALSLSKDSDTFHGSVVWYHPNGQQSQTAWYDQGTMHGELVNFDVNGKELARADVHEGTIQNGTAYARYNSLYTITQYTDGAIEWTAVYDESPSPTNAKIVTYYNLEAIADHVDYFDGQGKFIGTATTMEPGYKVIDGTEVDYAINPLVPISVAKKKNGMFTDPRLHLFSWGGTKAIDYFSQADTDTEQYIIAQVFFNALGDRLDSLSYESGVPLDGTLYTFGDSYASAFSGDTVKESSTYRQGLLDGPYRTYYGNGVLQSLTIYENQIPVGTKTIYSPNGTELYKLEYQDGEPWSGTDMNDYSVTGYSDGEIVEETVLYAPCRPKQKTVYENGQATSQSWYDPDGNHMGTYSQNGQIQNGTYVETDYNGWPVRITEYSNDNVVSTRYFYDRKPVYTITANGISLFTDPETGKSRSCLYQNGQPWEGTVLEYDYYNQYLTSEKNYINGQQHGLCRTFSFDWDSGLNILQVSENYRNGILNGTRTVFSNGIPQTEENYINGIVDGVSHYYDANGEKLSEATFTNGLPQEGTVYGFDYNGLVSEIIHYANGEKEGNASYFTYGELTSTETYENGQLVQVKTISPLSDTLNLEYKGGEPFEGKNYSYGVLNTYTDGQLQEQQEYDTETGTLLKSKTFLPSGNVTQTTYFSNGNVKSTCTFEDYYLNGKVICHEPSGKKTSVAYFSKGLLTQGTFIAFNVYSETEYIKLKTIKKGWEAIMVIDGKPTKKISFSILSQQDLTANLQDFIDMLKTTHYDYDFALLTGYLY
ncbi:MAG: hypothetical protein QM786_13940 [Breznakibacter sp.]